VKTKNFIKLILAPLILTSCIFGDDLTLGGLSDDDAIIAYYPLDGNAKDASGNGHDGEFTGGTITPITDRHGDFGKALYFDGTSNTQIEIPAAEGTNISDTDFTVSFWVYSQAASTGNVFAAIDTSSGSYAAFYTTNGNNLISDFTGTSGIFYTSTYFTLTNEWHFAVFTFDNTSQAVTAYLDGKYIDSLASTSFTCDGNQNFYIAFNIGAGYYFQGRIDDLTIFKRALSEREAEKLYRNTF